MTTQVMRALRVWESPLGARTPREYAQDVAVAVATLQGVEQAAWRAVVGLDRSQYLGLRTTELDYKDNYGAPPLITRSHCYIFPILAADRVGVDGVLNAISERRGGLTSSRDDYGDRHELRGQRTLSHEWYPLDEVLGSAAHHHVHYTLRGADCRAVTHEWRPLVNPGTNTLAEIRRIVCWLEER